MPDFDRTFRLLTGHARMFSWQRRLLHDWFLGGRLPDEIDLPTGLGKTSVMALWLMALAEQLGERRTDRLPLRYVHVVDDRALVDQASLEACRLARNLGLQPGLEWMRRALGIGREGLAVSTLHGGLAGSTRWLADPTSPSITVVTAENAISGLLFDADGTSSRMRSVRAALLGVDSLIVVDEIRLVPQFVRLVARLVKEGAQALWPSVKGIRPPRFLPMSATGCGRGTVFRLETGDLEDGIVARRLEAACHLRIERTGAGNGAGDVLALRLADAAWRMACGGREHASSPVRVAVFCDDGDLAGRVHDVLKRRRVSGACGDSRGVDIQFLADGLRVLERHTVVAERLCRAGFLPCRAGGTEVSTILVASATIAESMDIEVDRMVCDVVPLDRMILRFGRLARRKGEGRAVVVVDGMMLARRPAVQAKRLEGVIGVLERLGADASRAAFMRLRIRDPELFAQAVSPDPYPPWLKINLRGRPFLVPLDRIGTDEEDDCADDAARSEILWRANLPWRQGAPNPEKADVDGYLGAAPPHPLEGVKAPAPALASLLIRRAEALVCGPEAAAGPVREENNSMGAVLLSQDGRFKEAYTVPRLAEMSVAELEARIRGGTVLCSAGLGGLDAEGRLNPGCDGPVSTVDSGWPENWRRCLGFRIRQVAGEGLCRLERGWNRLFVMDLGRKNGNDSTFLVVDVQHEERGRDRKIRDRGGGRERLSLVAAEVARFAEILELSDGPARALELAGAWLDLGRAHDLWRRAFSASQEDGMPSTRRKGRDRAGFRDGWGSLFDMMEQIMPMDLDDELRDLVHHLISRHADAVPLASPEGMAGEEVAVGTGGRTRARLARLVNRYGQWGLAWLEMLLWVAECRAASEKSPPCWRNGCVDGGPDLWPGRT